MPVVAYYLGRPARIWIAAMSDSAPGNTSEPGRHRTRPARNPCRPRGEGHRRKPVHPQPRPLS
jgi:hypothetical protein